jgi:hypothetical protein
MPGLDRKGPEGRGPRTGRGQGRCRRRSTDDGAETAQAQRDQSTSEAVSPGANDRPCGGRRGRRGRGFGGGRP